MPELKNCGVNPLGIYEVKEGDTVQSVCAAFDVPPAFLIAANGLKEFPAAGAFLVIPRSSGEVYTVRAGDTLRSVCEKFGCDEAEFIRVNGCSYVYPTQRVCVGGRGGRAF